MFDLINYQIGHSSQKILVIIQTFGLYKKYMSFSKEDQSSQLCHFEKIGILIVCSCD
jgi:hypothetical protein